MQNRPIKEKTEKRVKKEYIKNSEQIKRNIAVLDKQINDTNDWDPSYQDYLWHKKILETQLIACNWFLRWWNLTQIKTDESGNMIMDDNWDLELVDVYDEDAEAITIASIWEAAYQAANQVGFLIAAEKTMWIAVLDTHAEEVDKIAKKVKTSSSSSCTLDERKLALIDNVEWIGKWWSDSTFNTVLEVTKQILIEVAICLVSVWVGNAISAWVRWTYRAGRRALQGIKNSRKISKLTVCRSGGIW